MGDSSRILQRLKAVVSFLNSRLVLPDPFFAPFIDVDRPLVVGYDYLWWAFSTLPYACMNAALLIITDYPNHKLPDDQMWDPFVLTIAIVWWVYSIFHLVGMLSIVYWHRDMPFQLIGPEVIFMMEVIPMITAAALRLFLEFNFGYLALLVGCTAYFYAVTHFLHVAYDIGGQDVLLGLLMLVLVYMLDVEFLVRALALGCCVSLSLCRYITYCAPEVPAHSKREIEQLLLC